MKFNCNIITKLSNCEVPFRSIFLHPFIVDENLKTFMISHQIFYLQVDVIELGLYKTKNDAWIELIDVLDSPI